MARPTEIAPESAVKNYLLELDKLLAGEKGVLSFRREDLPGGENAERRRMLNVLHLTDIVNTDVGIVISHLKNAVRLDGQQALDKGFELDLLRVKIKIKAFVDDAKKINDERLHAQVTKTGIEDDLAQKNLSVNQKNNEFSASVRKLPKNFQKKISVDIANEDINKVLRESKNLYTELHSLDGSNADKIQQFCKRIGVTFGMTWLKEASKYKVFEDFLDALKNKNLYLQAKKEFKDEGNRNATALVALNAQIETKISLVREKLAAVQAIFNTDPQLKMSFGEMIQALCSNNGEQDTKNPLTANEDRDLNAFAQSLASLEQTFGIKAEELRQIYIERQRMLLERADRSKAVKFDVQAAEIDSTKMKGRELAQAIVTSLRDVFIESFKDIRDAKIKKTIIRAIDAVLNVIGKKENGKNKWPSLEYITRTVLSINDDAELQNLEKIYPELKNEIVRSIENIYEVMASCKNDSDYDPHLIFGVIFSQTLETREEAEKDSRDKGNNIADNLKALNDRLEKGLLQLKNQLPQRILAIDIAIGNIGKDLSVSTDRLVAEKDELLSLEIQKRTNEQEEIDKKDLIEGEKESSVRGQNKLKFGDKDLDGSIAQEVDKNTNALNTDGRLYVERILPWNNLNISLDKVARVLNEIRSGELNDRENTNTVDKAKLKNDLRYLRIEMRKFHDGYKNSNIDGEIEMRDSFSPEEIEVLDRGEGGIDLSEDKENGTYFRGRDHFAAYLRKTIGERMVKEIDLAIAKINERAKTKLEDLCKEYASKELEFDQKIVIKKVDIEQTEAEIRVYEAQIALLTRLRDVQGEVNTEIQDFNKVFSAIYDTMRGADSGTIAEAVRKLAQVREKVKEVYKIEVENGEII